MNRNTIRNSFLLFLTACIWGMAFVSQSKGMDYMHPFTFNGVRSLIGALVLLGYIILTKRTALKKMGSIDWALNIKAGIWCGLALTLASTLQQFGIKYTTVGKAGFITTLYIIFVPLAGVFFRKRVSCVVWLATIMAAVGMYLLCITEKLALGMGDLLVFLCAIVFAAHIMIIDYYASKTDGVLVSCIQFAVCGVVCSAGALIWGQPTVTQLTQGMGTLLYAGVLSCGVAYTLQIIGQRDVNPIAAALILSLESVVAAISGWLAYRIGFLTTDESLTGKQMVGCLIVFLAVILVQLPTDWFKRKKTCT
ncbi:MAG: DMT family transporter [Lachnospiraceae bacterium]|nr:DMT family transporter [Lachnospiraceae bacterium]